MPRIAAPPPIEWTGDELRLLDQTLLPAREEVLALRDAEGVAEAIRRLAVRGAPNIGIAAAYGLALEAGEAESLERAWALLRSSRPTAVNLSYAVDRVRAAALAGGAAAARAEAEAIHAEEDAASEAIARHGAALLANARRPMTICNTGALAAGGAGTALAVIAALPEIEEVLACETRPLLQGARLTVYELRRLGIPHALVVDGAAPGLIRRGEVDAVVVGCDRVAASGDVANKVGTYSLALACAAAGIPFVVAGPTSSIDARTPDGAAIPIEERDADEVLHAGGALLTLPGTPVRNPAFDVTPAALITALVTERGVAQPVDRHSVAALLA
jgi:methylthioribose-1-phosphate isomerase